MNHYESDHQPVDVCSSSVSTCSSLSSYLKDHVHDACKSDMIYYIIAKADICITFFKEKEILSPGLSSSIIGRPGVSLNFSALARSGLSIFMETINCPEKAMKSSHFNHVL